MNPLASCSSLPLVSDWGPPEGPRGCMVSVEINLLGYRAGKREKKVGG